MLDVKEALKLGEIEPIKAEITRRLKIQEQMVGNLYPAILDGEIEQLRRRITELETGKLVKPDPRSAQYRNRAISLALSYCPPIYPCTKCGWPVFQGYQCGCGGRTDEGYEQFQ